MMILAWASTLVALLLALMVLAAVLYQEWKRRKLHAQLCLALEDESRSYKEFLDSALKFSGALLVNAQKMRAIVEKIEPANPKPSQNWD